MCTENHEKGGGKAETNLNCQLDVGLFFSSPGSQKSEAGGSRVPG